VLTLLHLVGAVASMASLMGFVYMIAALVAVARFARSGWTPPATRPAVTILKPVCGLDPGLYENLLSYCRQEYGAPVQVVIGAHRESDPAVAVARAVMAAVPEADVALVIDGALPGTNFKICNLSNMMAAAKHDVLVIADSDMRVGPDYLDSVVSKLSEPGVGIATTLYTARPIGGGLASRLGCGFINYGFLPSVLVGQLIHAAPFCSGATIALTRQTLERIGGFEALVNQLADDYAIGAAVRSLGLKVAIARYVPENLVTEANFRALFQHELRWQRTIRSITPLGLAASVITNPAALALVALPLSGFAGYAWLLLAATLAARLGVVYMCDRFFGLVPTGLSLVVPRELLSQIVLAASFCGQRVTWRNSNFQVGSGGKLTLEGDPLA
jgi:ceramide glucosyltransferase